MSEIKIRVGGEDGEAKTFDMITGANGELRVIDPESPPTADAAWVAKDMDDLAEQVSRDGHWLEGYLD